MKKLFDEGYVRRDQTRIPFRYSTVERVKQSFTKAEGKEQERETVSAHQAWLDTLNQVFPAVSQGLRDLLALLDRWTPCSKVSFLQR